MRYRVRLQPPAESDLDEAYQWVYRHAPETAGRWLARFREAINSLAEHPLRCGVPPEHQKLGRDLRQFLHGRKPNVFRVVFLIDGETVRILRIRRASRRALTRRELGDS